MYIVHVHCTCTCSTYIYYMYMYMYVCTDSTVVLHPYMYTSAHMRVHTHTHTHNTYSLSPSLLQLLQLSVRMDSSGWLMVRVRERVDCRCAWADCGELCVTIPVSGDRMRLQLPAETSDSVKMVRNQPECIYIVLLFVLTSLVLKLQ